MLVGTSCLSLIIKPIANSATADHPHGGGRGKSKGNVDPVSPWGMPVSHYDSFLARNKMLILRRPKEGTRPEKPENPTSVLLQLDNEIKGNEESSSGSYSQCHLLHPSIMYKR